MALAIFLATGVTMQAQDRLTQYKVRNAISVRTPIMNDSINPKGEKHTKKMLLQTPVVLHLPDAPMQSLTADTAGYLSFEKADKDNKLYLVKTQIRAERFLKGKLKITSPVRWEVFIDGASKQVKDAAEDSITSGSSRDIALSLEPERDYEIIIKLLSASDDKAAPTLKCELIKDEKFKDIACNLDPEAKKRFSLDNTVYGNRAISVSISPSGKYLLTRYWDNHAAKRSRTYCELTELKSGKVLLTNLRDGMSWMPKSDKLYYTVTALTGNDVITLDPATLREETILQSIPEQSFRWSPNEDFLIYYPREEGVKEDGPLRRIVSPADRIPNSRGRSFLAKYNLADGVSERLTYGNHSTYLQDISPDGKYMLYSTSKENITQRPFSLSSLYQVDLETLKVDTLFYEDRFIGGAGYSPDGKQLLLTGSPEAFGGIGKNCGNHPIANDFDTQAFIMDLSTRKIQPITKDFHPTVSPLQWNHGDGCIYFNTDDGDCKNIYRYSPKDGKFEKLNLETDVTSAFALSEYNPGIAAYIGQSDYNAGVAYLYDMKKKTSSLLADPMKPILEKIELGKTEPWNFTASDGTVITGKMCLPPNFDPNKKYPMMVNFYERNSETLYNYRMPEPHRSTIDYHLYNSNEYVIFNPDIRYVDGYPGASCYNCLMPGITMMIAKGYIDEKGIGAQGHSWGGYQVAYLATRTNLFSAIESGAPVVNMFSAYGGIRWGSGMARSFQYEHTQSRLGATPWSSPLRYLENSPLFTMDKVQTPILIMHNDADGHVPWYQGIEYFVAMKRLGKPCWLLNYTGEPHWPMHMANRIDFQRRMFQFFNHYLKNDKMPKWMSEGVPAVEQPFELGY